MYDRKSEANEFVADTEEDATAQACRFYGVEASELKISCPNDISGLEGRKLVVAAPKSFSPTPDRGDRGRSGPGGRSDRKDRDRDRGRGRDRERGGGSERRRSQSIRSDDPPSASAAESVAKPSKGEVNGELRPAGTFILGALERMRLGNFQLNEVVEEESNSVIYQVEGEAREGLAAGDGRTIDALQLLANQVVRLAEDDSTRIVIEVEGGENERRAESLEKVAERAAARAIESGRALALEAMNGRDRRVVHLALKERSDVATMGIGEGRYRQVLIVPEGAPEYDEAQRSSQSQS